MSITSETQRKYDPNKGGFSYYTLFHADKGERPSWAQDGDMLEEFGEGGKAYVCSRDAKGRIKWTEDANWDRQTGGGSSESGGGSGGGAEKFVVTLTEDDGTWTADEDVNDIYAAYQAGKIVSFITNVSQPIEYTDVGAMEVNYQGIDKAVLFSGIDDKKSAFLFAGYSQLAEGDDVWAIEYSDNELPSYSSSENGKVLGVDNGSVEWVDTNAPLIVTFTEDQSDNTKLVGDKTFTDVYTAFGAGCHVVLDFGTTKMTALAANEVEDGSSTSYTVTFYSDSLTELSGYGSDYLSITVQ